jgi:type I restriction enzyme, S subunit
MSDPLLEVVSDDWHVTTLGELCESGNGGIQTGPFGSQLHASDYVPVGVPSVMPQNIGDNRISDHGIARIKTTDAVRLSRYLLRHGDIVYSRRGDVGRRALVRPEQDGWLCGTGCLRVRLGDSASPAFISYYLGHPDVREWVVRHAIGATMPNLNTKILSSLPVSLPPEPVQRAVAAVLGGLDDKIALNERIAAKCFDLAQCLWSLAANESSEYVTVGEVVDADKGLSYKGAGLGAGVPLINLGNFTTSGRLKEQGLKFYSGETKDRHWVRAVATSWSRTLT